MKEYADLNVDLCILDIEMPGLNGIQVADMLKGKPFIFTTAYKEYATDAFDLGAIDYVIKPIKPERLKQAVHKAIQWIDLKSTSRKHVLLNTDKGNTLLVFNELIHIKTSEIDSRDKTAFLCNGTSLQLKNISFEKLISILPHGDFCRINKKEIIALKSVQYFSNDQITTNISHQSESSMVLTLGESYRAEFINKLNR